MPEQIMNAALSYRIREVRAFLVVTAFLGLFCIQANGQQGTSTEKGWLLELPADFQEDGFETSISSPPGSSTCGNNPGQTSFTITAEVDTDYNGTDVSCNGAADARVCAMVVGGIGPFEYQWFGVQGSNTESCLEGLGAGTYTVLVEDIGQHLLCATTVEVSEPAALALFDLTVNEPTCDGVCNGSVSAIPLGGTGDYTIEWNGESAGTEIPDVCEGVNNLQITDLNGCLLDTTITIVLDAVVPNLEVVNVKCFGTSLGSATASPQGGTGGGYIITWSNGQSGPTMDNEPEGDYLLTIDDNGCEWLFPFTIDEANEIEISPQATADPSCPSLEDGAILVFVEGGTPDYTFAWTGPDGFTADTEDLEDLAFGDYVLTVTDSEGCEKSSQTITLVEAPQVNFDPIIEPQTCDGVFNGSIDPQITGGFAPYIVSWTGPNAFTSESESISDLEAGTYDITVEDDHGCQTQASFEVPNGSLMVEETITQLVCQGDETGSIALVITGGSDPFDLDWTGPLALPNSPFIDNLPQGTYDVIITDGSGCQESYSYTIEAPNPILPNESLTLATCEGDLISVDLSPTGGTGSLLVFWTGPDGFESNNEDLLDEIPGVYNLTITDDEGCEFSGSFDLTIQDPITITALITEPSCSGLNNGSIEVAVDGGQPLYGFLWDGPGVTGNTSEDLADLDEGTYTLTVTDDQGCQQSETFVLERPTLIDAAFDISDVLCFGQNNGAIATTVSGAGGNYDFSWTGPDGFVSTSPQLTNLFAGTYNVTIVDGACTFEETIEVPQPDQITVNEIVIPESCDGLMNGGIELTLEGGVDPFIIVWNGPGTYTSNDHNITDLAPGDYTATISDENGCDTSFETSVDPGTLIEVSFDVDDTQCGQNAGSIVANPIGGTDPYLFAWEDEAGNSLGNDPGINDLEAGVYFVVISEAGGCEVAASTSISDTEAATLSFDTQNPSCNGGSDGSIQLTVTGDFPPYTIDWADPIESDQELVENLTAGTYNVTVTDANGCESGGQTALTEPEVLDVNAAINDEQCGGAPGAIDVTVTGGSEPYSYSWSGPEGYTNDTEDILGISAGDYELLVTDDLGCEFNFLATVEENSFIEITLVSIDTLCPNSDQLGSIDANVEGGSTPYTFSWTTEGGEVGNGEDLAGVPAGVYTLTVVDDEGCSESQEFEITELADITIDIDAVQPDCEEANGSVTANPSNGLEPYTFTWSLITDGGNTFIGDSQTLEGLATGSYQVVVIDGNGCEASTTFDLSNAPGEVTFVLTEPLCFGDDNGAIDITVTGVTDPLEYEWSDAGGPFADTQDVENLSAGQYNVLVTDANNCSVPATIDLTQPDELIMTLAASPAGCDGTPIGQITPAIDGGTEPYTYQWDGPDGFESNDESITDLSVGEYTLMLTDDNGCMLSANTSVELAETLEVEANIQEIVCSGDETGSIELFTFNGEPEIQFDWTGPDGFTATTSLIENLDAGQYDVIITDQSNCLVDTFFVVQENDPFETLLTVTQPTCSTNSVGSLELQAFSTSGVLTVAWTGPDAFESDQFDLIDVDPGVYEYTLTDSFGCQKSESAEISIPDPMEVNLELSYGNCTDNRFSVLTGVVGGVEPYNFDWTSTDGFTSSDPDLSHVEPGDYTLVVTDANGCQSTSQVSVDDILPIELVLDSTGFTPCFSASEGFISVTATGGQGGLSFDWTGPDDYTSNTEDIDNLFAGFYNLVVSDGLGCTYIENNIEIIVESDLAISAMPDTTLCLGEEGLLVTGTVTGAEAHHWEALDGTIVSEELEFVWMEPGEHTLVLYAESGVCTLTDTVQLTLFAYPVADAGADIFLFPEETLPIGGNPITEGDNEIHWSPEQGISGDAVSGYQVTLQESVMMYVLQVISKDGCITEDTVMVSLIPELTVPSGFSPNGDQINDDWEILSWQLYPSLQIGVYNRWGEQLYYSDSGYADPWDGNMNGQTLPVGTYYYIIEIDEPKLKATLTGPVTILE